VDDKKGRRYDTGLEPHQHIRCRRCGRLDNLPQWDAEAWLTASAPPDWVVEGWAVVADGVCPTCQAMPDQPPARADP
jgi:Fe2+ or Zn2+ uptake regulation protein